jgi:hypothetical protein
MLQSVAVQNPWPDLLSNSPYILGIDRESVDQFNKSAHGASRINSESVPDPFIGDRESARLVLLNLNRATRMTTGNPTAMMRSRKQCSATSVDNHKNIPFIL